MINSRVRRGLKVTLNSDDPAYFDAQEVRQNLSTQIVLPER